MNQKTLGIIVVVALVIIGGLYFLKKAPTEIDNNLQTQEDTNKDTSDKNNGTTSNVTGEGRVIFSVTDAAVDMTNISEVNLTINKIEAYHTLNGWSTISSTPKTYGLLALNAKKQSQIFADTNIKVGTYEQIRMTLGAINVKTTKGEVKTAKLPSNSFTLKTLLAVSKGKNSTVNLDFLAKESLYTTEIGDYVFAPVVKTETQSSAVVNIANGFVSVSSGRVDSTNTYGMDLDGSVKQNFKLDANLKIQIDASGKLKINSLLN